MPGDPEQVVWVWFDALINYLSGLGYGAREDWSTFGSEQTHKVHVLGKDVWNFHAVEWPAFLLSAGRRGPLGEWLAGLYRVAYWLQPFLPGTAARVLALLRGPVVERCPALFPRV